MLASCSPAVQIFLDATQHFSRDDASIADIIPAMDLLDEKLSDDSLNANFTLPIRAAVNLGKKVINKYYNKTDDTEAYRIAIGKYYLVLILATNVVAVVLHPSHKLEYFKLARWPAEWIKTAEDITREEYRRTYATSATAASQPSTAEVRPGFTVRSAPVKVSTLVLLVTWLRLHMYRTCSRTSPLLPCRGLPLQSKMNSMCSSHSPSSTLAIPSLGGGSVAIGSRTSRAWLSTTSAYHIRPPLYYLCVATDLAFL